MRRTSTPLIATAAGGLLLVGTYLPWVRLYAGLRELDGTTGAYGTTLLWLGGALLLVAVAAWRRPADRWRWATGLLGAAALYPSARAALGTRAIGDLDALLVAQPGPGPWVVLAGALIAFGALFLPRATTTGPSDQRTTLAASSRNHQVPLSSPGRDR